MVKKSLALLLAVLALLLAGCGKQTTVSSDTNVEETQNESTDSVIETAISTDDLTEESDSISALKVDKADYIHGVYLLRDNALYSLNEYVLIGKNACYSAYQRDGSASGEYYIFNWSDFGEFSVPIYQGGDKIVSYPSNSSSANLTLGLSRVEYKGYSVELRLDNYGNYYIKNSATPIYHSETDVYIEDSNGTELGNWHELEYGDIVKVYWYEGAEYHEEILKAGLKTYQVVDSSPEDFQGVTLSVEGEKTKNGYIEFDVSNVPAGIYMTNEYGLIEFK